MDRLVHRPSLFLTFAGAERGLLNDSMSSRAVIAKKSHPTSQDEHTGNGFCRLGCLKQWAHWLILSYVSPTEAGVNFIEDARLMVAREEVQTLEYYRLIENLVLFASEHVSGPC